jgi:hypothetical protein
MTDENEETNDEVLALRFQRLGLISLCIMFGFAWVGSLFSGPSFGVPGDPVSWFKSLHPSPDSGGVWIDSDSGWHPLRVQCFEGGGLVLGVGQVLTATVCRDSNDSVVYARIILPNRSDLFLGEQGADEKELAKLNIVSLSNGGFALQDADFATVNSQK